MGGNRPLFCSAALSLVVAHVRLGVIRLGSAVHVYACERAAGTLVSLLARGCARGQESATRSPRPASNGAYARVVLYAVCLRRLEDTKPNEMYTALPIIHFVPTVNYVPPDDEYQCPLYKTTVRAGILSTERQLANISPATTFCAPISSACSLRTARSHPIRSLPVNRRSANRAMPSNAHCC